VTYAAETWNLVQKKYVRNKEEETSMFGLTKVNDRGDPRLTPSFEIYKNNLTSLRKLKVEVHAK
jgi:hypothetical protein